MSTHLIALNPAELPAAQADLTKSIIRKIAAVDREWNEAEAALKAAEGSALNLKPFKSVMRRLKLRRMYLVKVKAALELGYFLIPNLPFEVIAVRTNESAPRAASGGRWNSHLQRGRLLPQAEGKYIDEHPLVEKDTTTDAKGKEQTTTYPVEFVNEINLPMEVARPEIIQATKRALTEKLFDQIGICRDWSGGIRSDPIVCGRLIDPSKRNRATTFFLAWTIDADLL